MTRKPDEWMPLHIGDYHADTTHLTRDQHGAYLLLLMAYWRRGGPLPADDARLAAIAKATPAEWRKLKPVMAEFFSDDGSGWVQKRADAELAKAKKLTEAKAEAGRKGAEKKWQTHGKGDGKQMAEPSSCHRQTDAPLPSPSTLTSSSLRSEGARPIDEVCKAFGIALTDDVRRLDWPGQLGEMLASGLSLADDILPACADARKRKIINLQWVRKRAECEKARRGIASQPIAPEFEPTDERGWRDRMRVWREQSGWHPKWGPKPDQPDCKCPPELLKPEAA